MDLLTIKDAETAGKKLKRLEAKYGLTLQEFREKILGEENTEQMLDYLEWLYLDALIHKIQNGKPSNIKLVTEIKEL